MGAGVRRRITAPNAACPQDIDTLAHDLRPAIRPIFATMQDPNDCMPGFDLNDFQPGCEASGAVTAN